MSPCTVHSNDDTDEDRFFSEASIYMPCYDPTVDTFERYALHLRVCLTLIPSVCVNDHLSLLQHWC